MSVKDRLKISFMRLFRDLSRFKARKRLYGNRAALIPILLGQEDPLPLFSAETAISTEISAKSDGFTMTLEELAEMDGRTETTPIYISLLGHVYDVSAARHMYGPGGSYHALVAKDATYLLAYGCSEEKCVAETPNTLTDVAKEEANRWLELYHNHDKYKYVGEIVVDFIDQLIELPAKE